MPNTKQPEQNKCCEKCSGYFEHRIGSHSDDRGGDSDYPCYCNEDKCNHPDCDCHKQNKTISEGKILTEQEVIDLVEEAGKDCEDVFEYLNGLEIKFDDGTKYYKLEDVETYINRL